MNVELDPESEALLRSIIEAEGWSSPAAALREFLVRHSAGMEAIGGYTKAEVLRLVSEADASPSREYTLGQLREPLRAQPAREARQAG